MRKQQPKKLILAKETLLSLDKLAEIHGGDTGYCPSRDAYCWWTDGCIIRA